MGLGSVCRIFTSGNSLYNCSKRIVGDGEKLSYHNDPEQDTPSSNSVTVEV